MATTKENANASANVRPADVIVKGKIVSFSEGYTKESISILTDQTFASFDKDGNENESNFLNLKISALCHQLAEAVPAIAIASAFVPRGSVVNPKLIALALMNAEFEAKREYHEKGEERQQEGETYSQNCWVTTITKVTPHVAKGLDAVIMNMALTAPTVSVIETTVNVPNPFGL